MNVERTWWRDTTDPRGCNGATQDRGRWQRSDEDVNGGPMGDSQQKGHVVMGNPWESTSKMSSETIFLSHATADRELATSIKQILEQELGVHCFMADISIEPGRPWRPEIEVRLRACLLGVVLLTAESCDRKWVMGEFLCLQVLNKRVFPILHGIDAERLPAAIQPLQCMQWEDVKNSRHFIEELRSAIEQSWMKLGDEFVRYLHDTRPLAYHADIKERFSESRDHLISRHFVRYWHREYCESLNDARNKSRLPLPSPARMAAAVDAIETTDAEIRAVAIVRNDNWIRSGDYLAANLEAAARDIRIWRVLILPSALHVKYVDSTAEVFEKQLAAGIMLRYIRQKEYKSMMDSLVEENLEERNLLICDNRIMTSSNAGDHAGYLVLDKDVIKYEILRFKTLWNSAAELNLENVREILRPR